MRACRRVTAALVLAFAAAAADAGEGMGQEVPIYLEGAPPGARVVLPGGLETAAERTVVGARLGIPTAEAFLSAPAAVSRRVGSFGLLLIPTLFADSPEPAFAVEELAREYLTGPSLAGTLVDYYDEASRGLFHVSAQVAPWARTSITLLEAAGLSNGHGLTGPRLREHVREAIQAADAEVDFGLFDNDGPDGVPNSGDDNGFVEGIAVLYPEIPGHCGGPGPWPHIGGVFDDAGAPLPTEDLRPDGTPVRIPIYMAASIVDCDGNGPGAMAVLAHELGHLIGLPDLYRRTTGIEAEFRLWAVGCYGLMAAGGWGCGSGSLPAQFGPTHPSGPLKARLGWVNVIEVTQADLQTVVLGPVATSGQVLKVSTYSGSRESFWFEYRTAAGFDAELPGEGVLMYHEDLGFGDRPVPEGLPPGLPLHLVEADADDALRKVAGDGGNRGVATDVFSRSGEIATLDASTRPSTRDHVGLATGITVHELQVAGGSARIVVSAGSPLFVAARDLPFQATAMLEVSAALTVRGGTPPYAVSIAAGALPEGVDLAVTADVVRLFGRPLDVGLFSVSVVVTDAAGAAISDAISFFVEDRELPVGGLVADVAVAADSDGDADTETERYLDNAGNGNGRLDVGDLRAYLLRRGQLP